MRSRTLSGPRARDTEGMDHAHPLTDRPAEEAPDARPTRRDAFEHLRAAWYAEHALPEGVFDEVRFGRYPDRGAPAGYLAVTWEEGDAFGAARLSVASADWPLLYRYRDVLRDLASLSNRPVTPADIKEVLAAHGFEDRTETYDAGPLFDPAELS